jgi:hypothetical protein
MKLKISQLRLLEKQDQLEHLLRRIEKLEQTGEE